jgi:hypothetical protein
MLCKLSGKHAQLHMEHMPTCQPNLSEVQMRLCCYYMHDIIHSMPFITSWLTLITKVATINFPEKTRNLLLLSSICFYCFDTTITFHNLTLWEYWYTGVVQSDISVACYSHAPITPIYKFRLTLPIEDINDPLHF